MNNLTTSLTQGLTAEQAESAIAGGVLGGIFVATGIAVLAWYILLIVAYWKIFKKAGIAGWKSLIPIYNIYLIFKLSGIKQWFWIQIAAMLICDIVIQISGGVKLTNDYVRDFSAMSIPADFATVAQVFITVAMSIFVNYNLSRAFKHGIGFTIGLVLFPNIFTLILGFGSSKYNKRVLS